MAISLKRAVEGFNLHLEAAGRSTHTLRDYNTTLDRFQQFIGADTRLDLITPDRVRQFLQFWRDATVQPAGLAPRPPRKLSKKSLKNMHTALSSFFSWALQENFIEEHPIKGHLDPPRANRPGIDPLTEQQVADLLAACNGSLRNAALVNFMIDTGCRASEVCGLSMRDLDLRARSATVTGKGDRIRIIPFGARAGRALFRYLAERDDQSDPDQGVFLGRGGVPLTRRGLLGVIQRAGKRAGIQRCYPHRLRHTFAIMYLRNAGDIYTLQDILGHSSLDMVKTYLRIAGTDVRQVHRRASPMDNMKSLNSR